jgi:hypothetical protein
MKDIETRLAEIEARIAISELRSKYCWYTVRGNRSDLLTLFTEDGIFQNARTAEEHPVTVTGKKELAEYFERIAPARRVPLATNEVITIDGGRAEGTCAMVSVGDDSFTGHYIDTFEKVQGKWLFSARRFFPYWPVYRPAPDRPHP